MTYFYVACNDRRRSVGCIFSMGRPLKLHGTWRQYCRRCCARRSGWKLCASRTAQERAESHRSPRYILQRLVLSAGQKQLKKNWLTTNGFSTYSHWVAVDTSCRWFALVIFKDLIRMCFGHRQGSHSIPALNVPNMESIWKVNISAVTASKQSCVNQWAKHIHMCNRLLAQYVHIRLCFFSLVGGRREGFNITFHKVKCQWDCQKPF